MSWRTKVGRRLSERRNIDREFYDIVSDPTIPLAEAARRGAKLIRRRNEPNRMFMWWMASVFRAERERQAAIDQWEVDGGATV